MDGSRIDMGPGKTTLDEDQNIHVNFRDHQRSSGRQRGRWGDHTDDPSNSMSGRQSGNRVIQATRGENHPRCSTEDKLQNNHVFCEEQKRSSQIFHFDSSRSVLWALQMERN
jgi:hypothetical protein